MKTIKVKITFLEELLGSLPNSEEIYKDYVASKAPNSQTMEEEVEALGVDESVERGTTVFPRTKNEEPFIYDYQIKGFFKDTCSALSRLSGKDGKKKIPVNESGKLTAFKKIIDGLIFVKPREIIIHFDGEIGFCQRPLRAQTAQGERIALASSETIPAGSYILCDILCLSSDYEATVIEWLDYGALKGLGQWRNSGKGRFEWERLSE